VIEITRDLARELRAVFRRSAWPAGDRRAPPPVVFRRDGPRLTAHSAALDLAALFTAAAGAGTADALALPAKALADFEGRDGSPVRLEAAAGKVHAAWHDRGVLVSNTYDAPEPPPAFPEAPEAYTALDPSFLAAFNEAARTASVDGTRAGLSRVQLRGGKGRVVATDGRQLLLHEGFPFPWPDDRLVPRVAAFGLKELARHGPPAVAFTDAHVFVRAGPWTVALPVDRAARFPDAEAVIPKANGRAARWRVQDREAAFLARALPALPGADGDLAPVTLDLGDPVAVRARGDGQDCATEIVLPRSERDGPPGRLCMNRGYLARALVLGFREVVAARAGAPLVCRDGPRTYVWMTLDARAAVPPGPDDVRINGAEGAAPIRAPREAAAIAAPASGEPSTPDQEPRNPLMANKPPTDGPQAPADNGGGDRVPAPAANGPDALLEEAQALCLVLREALGRLNQLTAAIKAERRQRRLVQSTLASLRQLQQLRP
jgi:hypothetical protein